MTSQGISFAEVLKRKIQKEAEEAKIRLVEEAKAREEEARAKEARDAELKLKKERAVALREAQPEDYVPVHSRFHHGGRPRFGQRAFSDRRRVGPFDSPPARQNGGASVLESSPMSESPDKVSVPEVPANSAAATDNQPAIPAQTVQDELPVAEAESNSTARSEKNGTQDNICQAVMATPVVTEPHHTTAPSPAVEPASKNDAATISVLLADVPVRTVVTAVAQKPNGVKLAEKTEKLNALSNDDVRVAQRKNSAQNGERRKSNQEINYAANHHQSNENTNGHPLQNNGSFQYPVYYTGFDVGQQVPHHTEFYNCQVQGVMHSPPFYPTVPQYFQPVTEITTRNGPLFINPLAYSVCSPDTYVNGLSRGYYGQNSFYLAPGPTNGDLPNPSNVLSPPPSLIKSFYFDSEQTGIIIGKLGGALNDDRWRCDCEIWIDEEEARLRGVSTLHLYGLEKNVNAALNSIRRRVESNGGELYPIIGLQTGNELYPPIMKLDLPHGVILQAFISHVEEPGLVFLQLPSHPTYLKIRGLEVRLSNYCGDNGLSPFIDVRHTPLVEGAIVAASVNEDSDQWLRAAVISEPDEDGEIQLRSLDHGFPFQSHASNLKFLPAEFCVTPLQAIECRAVSGKFDPDKLVAEQIDENINVTISRQWVKVKAVSEMAGTGFPVVEILMSTPSSTAPAAANS